MSGRFLIWAWPLAFCLGFSHLPIVGAASFDCSKAANGAERIVCGASDLQQLDERLAGSYERIRQTASETEWKKISGLQRDWIRLSRNKCGSRICVKHAYLTRLAELETYDVRKSREEKGSPSNRKLINSALASQSIRFLGAGVNSKQCDERLQILRDERLRRYIDPHAFVESYESSQLRSVRGQCDAIQPLTYQYLCDGRMQTMYTDDIQAWKKDIDEVCAAHYLLPPFAVYRLPGAIGSSGETLVLHTNFDYGPMNFASEHPRLNAAELGGFYLLNPATCEAGGTYTRARYVSGYVDEQHEVLNLAGNHYFLFFSSLAKESRLTLEPVDGKAGMRCSWAIEK